MSKVAFLLPVYNASRFLRECLDSILTQTYHDFELIACDDGSLDESLSILREYELHDNRVRVIANTRNLGIAATRNRLLSELSDSVRFIALMDADDVCFSNRLTRQMDFLDAHPEIAAVGASLEIIDENDDTTGFRKYPVSSTELKKTILKSNPLSQSSLLLRREVFESIGEYDEKCIASSDYAYWLKAMKKFKFANLSEPVIYYRISSSQIKQTHLKDTLRTTLRLQRKYLLDPDYRSLFAFIRHMALYPLLLLPNSTVLKIFQLLVYRTNDR